MLGVRCRRPKSEDLEAAPISIPTPPCRELNIVVIARVPFGEGSSIGELTKDSRWPKGDWHNHYFGPENLPEALKWVKSLKRVAPKGMSLSELALRFIPHNPIVSYGYPG